MNRAARLLPPLRRQPLQTTLLPTYACCRSLSTETVQPRGPFSALWRTQPKPISPFVSRPSLPSRSKPAAGLVEKADEVDEFHDREEIAEEESTVEADASKTPNHQGIQAAVEESGAQGTEVIPKDSEYWDEKVEEFTTERANEISAMTLQFEEDLDPALKPWQKPLLPRTMRPGEPIVLPLSSLGAIDPTAPVPSGLGISLPSEIFGSQVRRDILHYSVVWWRAGLRRGTHKNKSRGEVAYSKRKLRPQKKTGKARLGSAGAPYLRKGGRAFPKRPRDYTLEIPRKVRAMGIRMALSAKLYMGTLRIVENLNEANWLRTKDAVSALTGERLQKEQKRQAASASASSIASGAFGEGKDRLSILFLHPPNKPAGQIWDFARPLRNIPGVEVMCTDQVEVYHLLHYRWVVMEAGCVDALAKHAGQIDAVPGSFPEAEVVIPDPYAEQPIENVVQHVEEQPVGVESSGDQGLVSAARDNQVAQVVGWTNSGMANWVARLEKEPPAQVPTMAPMRNPATWVLNNWRKIRGKKSMRNTFGLKRADAYQLIAKRAWKKIRRSGRWATPERVAMEINVGRVGGRKAITAVKK